MARHRDQAHTPTAAAHPPRRRRVTGCWPAPCPDGTKLAFVSRRDGNDEVYAVNADGSNLTNLSNHPSTDFDPVWRPEVR